jgi:methionine synthase / methylenetetrahydrofolate reductase(NADPH)
MKKPLIEFIRNSRTPIVADGGMATSLYDKGFYLNRSFEELSILHAEAVREVTAGFRRAGAQLLTTNTFGAIRPKLTEYGLQDRLVEILQASVNIARGVANGESYVLGCIGPLGRVLEPLGPTSFEEAVEIFGENARILEGAEVDGFTLIGFHDLKELKAAVQAIRLYSGRPVFAHVGIQDNQKTNYGNTLPEYAGLMNQLDVDVLGLAGEVGPSGMLTALQSIRDLTEKPISLLPNAGFPRLVNDQYIYLCNPDYIGKFAKRFVQAGANIVGGHSGVGEQHIRAIANALRMTQGLRQEKQALVQVIQPATDEPAEVAALNVRSKLGAKLAARERVVSVELNPPRGVDSQAFFNHCAELAKGGVEFVNVPDGARAVARVSSTHLSGYIQKTYGLEAIPHFTARDRNLIGLQSDLLGAHLNGVRNVLLVTGDPPKLGNCPGATGVYDVDAIGMTHILSRMNQGLDLGGSSFGQPTEFVVGVALNPTAPDLELELRRFRYKVEAGADFAITQPIYDVEAYRRFLDQVQGMNIPIMMGIWPLVSLRNAEFLKNEVPGVSVPDWVLEEMEKAGDNKDDAVKRGLDIAVQTMVEARNEVAGFQVSAPFNRVEVALKAIHGLD